MNIQFILHLHDNRHLEKRTEAQHARKILPFSRNPTERLVRVWSCPNGPKIEEFISEEIPRENGLSERTLGDTKTGEEPLLIAYVC